MSVAVATGRPRRLSSLGPLFRDARFSAWLAFVSLCVLAAAVLRLTNLGKYGFWVDEYFHVFAARSLLVSGKPLVPMLGEYHRALGVTYITAAMFKFFGESEFTARLPFALTNVAFIAISAVVVRRLFSDVVSGAYALCMAFAPLAVDISRECRFYTLHQLFYFGAAAAFFAGFENVSGRLGRSGRRLSMDWRWLVAAVPLAAAALHFQTLTLNLVIAAVCYLIAMAMLVVIRQGWVDALTSKYVLVILLGAAGAAVLYHADPRFFREKWGEAFELYDWQAALGISDHFYRYYFIDNFPAFTFLFPVGAYVAVRRYGKAGLYAVCSSAPLFFLHAFVYARKSERYVFYFFPFFLITALIAVEPVLEWAWERARVALKKEPLRAKIVAAAFLLPGFLVLVHPWALIAMRAPFRAKNPDWKSLDPELKRNLLSATVITTNPREYLYYVGAYPTYYRLVELNPNFPYEPTLLRSDTEFAHALRHRGDVYFVGAEWNFYNNAFMSDGMRNAVSYLMSPVDHGGDRRILVYHRNS